MLVNGQFLLSHVEEVLVFKLVYFGEVIADHELVGGLLIAEADQLLLIFGRVGAR